MVEASIEKVFFQELDEFQFHMPGNRTVPFSDDQNLLDMVQRQYPGWKERGRITSVPPARVPSVFLEDFQMHGKLRKILRSVQRGEAGEMKLYRSFVDGSFDKEPGMMVFPNFDGSHIFRTNIAKVEIDMVLVHSKKGIFVFNVKNQLGGASSLKQVKNDIEKHTRLIRLLLNYKKPETNENIPIHAVICDCGNSDSKFSALEQSKIGDAKVMVFTKKDLGSSDFSKIWSCKLDQAGVQDINWTSLQDALLSRLIALASMEKGFSALIHDRLISGIMQSVSKKEHLKTQISCDDFGQESEALKEAVVQRFETENQTGKKKFILWTKEQVRVIAKVYKGLNETPDYGIRLLVTGGKGSGKTLLITALAKMAASSISSETEKTSGSVLMCEGTFKSIGLLNMMEKNLSNTGITIEGGLPSTDQLQGIKIFFCDESSPQLYKYFLDNLREDQHCVLFSSDNSPQIEAGFEHVHLSSCLRSTRQIAHFANRFLDVVSKNVYLALPNAKLVGERVEVTFVQTAEKRKSLHFEDKPFLSKCIDIIHKNVQRLDGLGFVVVVPFVKLDFLQLLIERLEELQYRCHEQEVPSNLDLSSRTHAMAAPISRDIFFCKPQKIEGCEFSTVVVLVDAGFFETFTFSSFGNPILTAVTRASLRAEIIVNDCDIPDDNHMHKYLTNIHEEKMKDAIDRVRKLPAEQKPTVLFVGKLPNAADFQQVLFSDDIPEIEDASLYRAQRGCFLHMNDIYLQSDLQKLFDFGIREIFIANTDLACRWNYLFYVASIHCVRKFSLQRAGSLLFNGLAFNVNIMKLQVDLHLEFFRQQSSANYNPDFCDHRFWQDFEESMPLDEPANWRIWKDKAEQLYKIGEITSAITTYEISIKLLKRRIESVPTTDNSERFTDEQGELAQLYRTVSRIYAEHARNIIRGTRMYFNFENFHFEEGLVKAFRNAVEAVRLRIDLQQEFELINLVISKLRSYSQSESFKLTFNQLIFEEKTGNKICRLRHQSNVSFMAKDASFDAEMGELDSLISNYDLKTMNESTADLSDSRKAVSAQAKKMSERSLSLILEASADHQPEVEDQFEHLFNVVRQLFEYPVQLAMLSIHWHLPEKNKNEPEGDAVPEECPQVLDSALSQLQNATNQLFEPPAVETAIFDSSDVRRDKS